MAGTDTVLTIAALGRPFHLGSLYDIRSDQIIAGATLWSKEALEEKIHEQNIWSSNYKVTISDSMHDKTSALEISGNLNLSIQGGLVEAKGSAKYLENGKKSGRQERVTLQYKCTTKATELTMEHLNPGNIKPPDIMDKGMATHVVTGIQYGAHAFFIFDRTYDTSETGQIVSGNLFSEITKIPMIAAQLDGNCSEQQGTVDETVNCRFCGDFYLKTNPSTYQEAVRIYRELPSLLGENGENAVPIRVTLFPLAKLDTRALHTVQEISNHLVYGTEKTLETIYEIQAICSDLLHYEAAKTFPRIKQEMFDFDSLIQAFKRGLQRKLSVMLPAIRGGGHEEASLAVLLQRIDLSPFSSSSLRAWTNRQEEQVKILSGYISSLKGTALALGAADLQSIVVDLEISQILCLIILVPRLTTQLENMRNYLQTMDTDQENPEVKAPRNLVSNKTTNVRSFKDFVNINKDDTKTKFVVMEEGCDTEELGAVVRYYKDGHCVSENYELPSAPCSVEVNDDDTCHDQVTVRWSPPRQGAANVQRYQVKYWKTESEDCPKIQWSNTNHATLTQLMPSTTYQVRVQAWCEVGFSSQLDDITVQTRPVRSLTNGNKTDRHTPFLPHVDEDSVCGIGMKYYGVKSNRRGKTILLLGASGSGKTTVVNFIANNFNENASVDRPLIQVTDGDSKNQTPTRTITAYTFCASQNDSPITVIDTPGLDASSGEKVRGYVLSLMTLLANCVSEKFDIHAIGFVAPAHRVRLTASERLVINYIPTLFAKGFLNHMITFVTFSENQQKPPVIQALKKCNVICKYFKFNNGTLSRKVTNEIGHVNQTYWRAGCKNWKRCVKAIQEMSTLTVNTTKSLQRGAKSTRLTDLVERNLMLELKKFIHSAKDYSWFTNTEAVKACESVWNLAAALTCQSCLRSSESTSVEKVNSTLVEFTKDICKSNGQDAELYVRLLSLAPSRSLVKCGVEMLQSSEQLYRRARSNDSPDKEITPMDTYTIAYCRRCYKDHKMVWVKNKVYGWSQKCKDCQCEFQKHNRGQEVDYPMELLKHAKLRLAEAGRQLSIPGFPVTFMDFITFLECVTQGKYYYFINNVKQA